MLDSHPLATRKLQYRRPDGTSEWLSPSDAVDRGFEVLRACLLNGAGNPQAYSIIPSLIHVASGGESGYKSSLVSSPLVDELEDAGTVIPAAWTESLEALDAEISDESRALRNEPNVVEDLPAAMGARLERTERNSRAAWVSEGLVASPAVDAAPAMRARSATGRGRSPRSRRSRATASSHGPPGRSSSGDDDPPLAPLRRLVRAVLRPFARGRR